MSRYVCACKYYVESNDEKLVTESAQKHAKAAHEKDLTDEQVESMKSPAQAPSL